MLGRRCCTEVHTNCTGVPTKVAGECIYRLTVAMRGSGPSVLPNWWFLFFNNKISRISARPRNQILLSSQASASTCIHLVYVHTWTLTAHKASTTNSNSLYGYSYTKTESLFFNSREMGLSFCDSHISLRRRSYIYYRKVHKNVNARLTLVSIQYITEFVLCIAFLSISCLLVWDVPEQHESLTPVSYL